MHEVIQGVQYALLQEGPRMTSAVVHTCVMLLCDAAVYSEIADASLQALCMVSLSDSET